MSILFETHTDFSQSHELSNRTVVASVLCWGWWGGGRGGVVQNLFLIPFMTVYVA